MSGKYYHREIDGLRAISVGVIILYHLGVREFRGGFVGVDVFFVVSGFLISQIILSELGSGTFTFANFYRRRVLRIIPALTVTVLFTLLACAYLMQPAALVHSAKQGAAALLSVSNLFFWSEASYWAPAAENFVLLHTWSLGVEEQFYLVYPLLLFLAQRYAGVPGVVVVLVALLVLGVLANEWTITRDRSAAFYLTPVRFYEFAVGGLGALLFHRTAVLRNSGWLSGGLTLIGLGMILYSAMTFHPLLQRLPGYLTLIPTGGALLVILAGASAPARILLSNPLSVWLGKTSYSLYLVHWPIIVLYRYRFGGELSLAEQLLLVAVTCVAAECLCRYVEHRFRLRGDGVLTVSGVPGRRALLVTAALTGMALTVAIAAIASNGWPQRMDDSAQQLLQIDTQADRVVLRDFLKDDCRPRGEPLCGERDPDRRNIILLGDSRGLDTYMALRTAYPDVAIRASSLIGCGAVFDRDASFSLHMPDCYRRNVARLQAALEAPDEDIVFLANDLGPWRRDAILATVEQLRAAGKTVFILGEFRILNNRDPIEVTVDALRFGGGDAYLDRFIVGEPFALDGEYADAVSALGATYVSFKPLFYDGNYHLEERATGRLLTYDGTHLNSHGARVFGRHLREHYPLPDAAQ